MKLNPLPFLREKWTGVIKLTASFAERSVLVTGNRLSLDPALHPVQRSGSEHELLSEA